MRVDLGKQLRVETPRTERDPEERSSKPVRRAIPGGRVRFPSASAQTSDLLPPESQVSSRVDERFVATVDSIDDRLGLFLR